MKILILGGTREAADLAARLTDEGHEVTTSLAGRTREPKPLRGMVRIGGYGGAQGLAEFLKENRFDKLIDATHPFARRISQNAASAAAAIGIAFETATRPPWKQQAGDVWLPVSSLEEACKRIPAGARALLALGSQHIDGFRIRDDVFFLVRMVDAPAKPLSLPRHEIILGTPSPDWKAERDLLLRHDISHIICRNSGGTGAYAKIEAARELELPVIMVSR